MPAGKLYLAARATRTRKRAPLRKQIVDQKQNKRIKRLEQLALHDKEIYCIGPGVSTALSSNGLVLTCFDPSKCQTSPVCMTKQSYRYLIENLSVNPLHFRMLMFWYRSDVVAGLSVAPGITNVLAEDKPLSCFNFLNRKNYRIIRDKNFVLQGIGTDVVANTGRYIAFNSNKKVKLVASDVHTHVWRLYIMTVCNVYMASGPFQQSAFQVQYNKGA